MSRLWPAITAALTTLSGRACVACMASYYSQTDQVVWQGLCRVYGQLLQPHRPRCLAGPVSRVRPAITAALTRLSGRACVACTASYYSRTDHVVWQGLCRVYCMASYYSRTDQVVWQGLCHMYGQLLQPDWPRCLAGPVSRVWPAITARLTRLSGRACVACIASYYSQTDHVVWQGLCRVYGQLLQPDWPGCLAGPVSRVWRAITARLTRLSGRACVACMASYYSRTDQAVWQGLCRVYGQLLQLHWPGCLVGPVSRLWPAVASSLSPRPADPCARNTRPRVLSYATTPCLPARADPERQVWTKNAGVNRKHECQQRTQLWTENAKL